MDYKKLLETFLRSVNGALVVSFCGMDGLGIANATYDILPPNLEVGDAQISALISHKKDSLKQIGITDFIEDIIIVKNYVILIRMLSDDYFVFMTCNNLVDIKLARYRLYQLAEKLKSEIA